MNDSSAIDTSKIVSGLQENSQYFWRVRAESGIVRSPFSSTRSFQTGLGVPSLARPAANAVDLLLPVTVAWQPVAGASRYHLQVGAISDLGSGLLVNDSTVIDTSRVLSGLLNNTTYFWRVRAAKMGGLGDFSSTGRFVRFKLNPQGCNLVLSCRWPYNAFQCSGVHLESRSAGGNGLLV